jgi:hypothetical protein
LLLLEGLVPGCSFETLVPAASFGEEDGLRETVLDRCGLADFFFAGSADISATAALTAVLVADDKTAVTLRCRPFLTDITVAVAAVAWLSTSEGRREAATRRINFSRKSFSANSAAEQLPPPAFSLAEGGTTVASGGITRLLLVTAAGCGGGQGPLPL